LKTEFNTRGRGGGGGEEEEVGRLVISTTFITEGDRKVSALKLDRPCPLVLLVKVG